jgi:hypothetical protein
MNATIRIRRAQLYAAMTSRRAQSIAALQQGRRFVYASVDSRQCAALAGIIDYWTINAPPSRPTDDHPIFIENMALLECTLQAASGTQPEVEIGIDGASTPKLSRM